MAVICPQNDDLTNLLKPARKKVPQSARLNAGEGGVAKAIWAMPKCLQHEFERGFQKSKYQVIGTFGTGSKGTK